MPTKTIVLSHEELASVQRLLSNLAETQTEPVGDSPEVSHVKLLKIAQMIFALRRQRAEYLHRSMLGEPAFDMLLALYVSDIDGGAITSGRLAEIAGVAQSSAVRWVEYLVGKQLIDREPHPKNKRSMILKLSSKGRDALEGVFRAMFEGFRALDF